MLIRRRILLVFLLFGCLPAVILAGLLFGLSRSRSNARFRDDLAVEAKDDGARLQTALTRRETAVLALGSSSTLLDFIGQASSSNADPNPPAQPLPAAISDQFRIFDLSSYGDLHAVYCFGANRQALFSGERPANTANEQPFRLTGGRSASSLSIDSSAWEPRPPVATLLRDGVVRYYVPLELPGGGHGLLAIDLSLAHLLADALPAAAADSGRYRIVLSQDAGILAHTGGNIRYQSVSDAFPSFTAIAKSMTAGETGSGEFSDGGRQWMAAYSPVGRFNLSVAVVADLANTGAIPWLPLAIGLVLALIGASLSARWFTLTMRREQIAIDRVTQGAGQIAAGKLNQRIEVKSSAELRNLADSFNLMTDKLREQIARETEARQFRSFMSLSAMVTHDLKNAIQALSLLVSNMEVHYDNPEFRPQALLSLTRATAKLSGLVARLSEPMRSMSGELPRPQPANLANMLRLVLRSTAELDQNGHTLVTEIPEKLVAEVDAERIEKVFENLIINALQAMGTTPGTLTVRAEADEKNCTVTMSDTGPGMTDAFKRDKLFRAFATTKPLGIGLGLYTCREVIRAHGGTIEVESESGSGTTFRVVLPLRSQALWTN